MARKQAKRERDQIVKAMEQAQVTVWSMPEDKSNLTLIVGGESGPLRGASKILSAAEIEALTKMYSDADSSLEFNKKMESVLSGEVPVAKVESKWNNRWHKVSMVNFHPTYQWLNKTSTALDHS